MYRGSLVYMLRNFHNFLHHELSCMDAGIMEHVEDAQLLSHVSKAPHH